MLSVFFMRTKLDHLRSHFERISERSRILVEHSPEDRLYWHPKVIPHSLAPFSFGEFIVRSAAMVEQSFGGITTRLWDDPFEWTLPEKLTTKQSVLSYLAEVDSASERGFAFLKGDADLDMQLPAPVELRSIFAILIDAIGNAEHFQGRAISIFQLFSDKKPPRI
jgi:hypothetical protein